MPLGVGESTYPRSIAVRAGFSCPRPDGVALSPASITEDGAANLILALTLG